MSEGLRENTVVNLSDNLINVQFIEKKVQTRLGVFETNSSSSHSLTMSDEDLVGPLFPDDVLINGVLKVELRSFGWEWDRFYRPENKAAYLIVSELDRGFSSDFEDDGTDLKERVIEQSERAGRIIRLLEEYSGCRVVVQGGGCSIDHDSVGTASGVHDLKQFLFSKSYITLGNDNDTPDTVQTDLGTSESVGEDYRRGYY